MHGRTVHGPGGGAGPAPGRTAGPAQGGRRGATRLRTLRGPLPDPPGETLAARVPGRLGRTAPGGLKQPAPVRGSAPCR